MPRKLTFRSEPKQTFVDTYVGPYCEIAQPERGDVVRFKNSTIAIVSKAKARCTVNAEDAFSIRHVWKDKVDLIPIGKKRRHVEMPPLVLMNVDPNDLIVVKRLKGAEK